MTCFPRLSVLWLGNLNLVCFLSFCSLHALLLHFSAKDVVFNMEKECIGSFFISHSLTYSVVKIIASLVSQLGLRIAKF